MLILILLGLFAAIPIIPANRNDSDLTNPVLLTGIQLGTLGEFRSPVLLTEPLFKISRHVCSEIIIPDDWDLISSLINKIMAADYNIVHTLDMDELASSFRLCLNFYRGTRNRGRHNKSQTLSEQNSGAGQSFEQVGTIETLKLPWDNEDIVRMRITDTSRKSDTYQVIVLLIRMAYMVCEPLKVFPIFVEWDTFYIISKHMTEVAAGIEIDPGLETSILSVKHSLQLCLERFDDKLWEISEAYGA